jgi:hypothetical protein
MADRSENARDRIADAADRIADEDEGGREATPAEKKSDAIRKTEEG